MYCAQCGKPIAAEARYCPSCGAPAAFTAKPVGPNGAADSQAGYDVLRAVGIGMVRIFAWIGANVLLWVILGIAAPQAPQGLAALFGNPGQSTPQAVAFSAGFTASGLLPAFIALAWKRRHALFVILVNACSIATNYLYNNPSTLTPRTGWLALTPLVFWVIAVTLACIPRLGKRSAKQSSA